MVSLDRIACISKLVLLFNDHLIQDRPHSVSGACTFVHCIYHRYAFRMQVLHELTAVIETPGGFHICHRIPLDFCIRRLLFDDVDEL